MGKTLSKYMLLPIVAVLGWGPCHGQELEAKQPISKAEFFALFKEGRSINGRDISADIIIDALKWAQEQYSDGTPSAIIYLAIANSTIRGSLYFQRLHHTNVKDLRPDLRQHYEQKNIKEVTMIPIGLSFSNSTFDFLDCRDTVFLKMADFGGSTLSADFRNNVFGGTAVFQGTRFGNAEFGQSSFLERAYFGDATFDYGANFYESEFQREAIFTNSSFAGRTSFRNTIFQDALIFTKVRAEDISFRKSLFHNDAFFMSLNESSASPSSDKANLDFSEATFYGRLNFSNARLNTLSFYSRINNTLRNDLNQRMLQDPSSEESISPVRIKQRAVFTRLNCNSADFREAEFSAYADFSEARFSKSVDYSRASFDAEANFYQTEFPPINGTADQTNRSGILLEKTNLNKPINLEWKQLDGKINPIRIETLRRLENGFKETGNLDGQNAAFYQRKLIEGFESKGWPKIANNIERFYWGYGVRPLRLVISMLAVYLLFTGVYWTQTKSLRTGQSRWHKGLERLRFSLIFSLRTSWKMGHGYQNARSPTFKMLTLTQSILFKVMLLCLIKALSNTSPLLNELVGKLVHL